MSYHDDDYDFPSRKSDSVEALFVFLKNIEDERFRARYNFIGVASCLLLIWLWEQSIYGENGRTASDLFSTIYETNKALTAATGSDFPRTDAWLRTVKDLGVAIFESSFFHFSLWCVGIYNLGASVWKHFSS